MCPCVTERDQKNKNKGIAGENIIPDMLQAESHLSEISDFYR